MGQQCRHLIESQTPSAGLATDTSDRETGGLASILHGSNFDRNVHLRVSVPVPLSPSRPPSPRFQVAVFKKITFLRVD